MWYTGVLYAYIFVYHYCFMVQYQYTSFDMPYNVLFFNYHFMQWFLHLLYDTNYYICA